MNELQLKIRYQGREDFTLDLDCKLPARGITAIYGPSGSGKTSLLDCIAGLRQADSGSRICFREETWQENGKVIPAWNREIGYVFQDARLFSHLHVKDNLEYGLRRRGQRNGPTTDQIARWLDLENLLHSATEQLSAGQKQRVAIGRALLSAPKLLLLDEPLANLDHRAAQQCLGYLQRLEDELDLPMLYVSHDIEEVSQLADQLLLLENGQVVDQGSTLALCSRLDTRLSQEEQAAAITLCKIARHDPDFGLTELDLEGQALYVSHLDQAPGQRRRVRIPARDVSICRQRPQDSSILNILPVTLLELRESGEARIMLRLGIGGQHLLARITRKSAHQLQLQVGDALFAQVKSAALLMEAGDNT
jgi:molybdate transport system ATP-binding protein